jgi:hypothetical protein
MEKVFDERLTKDGFGVRVVARFNTATADWLEAMNSSIHITAECKVPGSDWIEVVAKSVGLAYEHFEQVAGTGVGFKLSRIEQVGPRSGRVKLKLKTKVAGDKTTLKEDRFTFNF